MIKTVFFDLDGVLTLDAKGSLTMSMNLCAAKQDLLVDDVLQSFRKDIEHLTLGQCSLQEVIERVCTEFSIPYSQELFLNVARRAPWNKPMLALAHSLRTQYSCGIITDNSKERMEILSQEPELLGFNPIVVSAVEHVSKSDGSTAIYDRALQLAGCLATEAVFIDNQKRNLIVPAKMGMKTYFHDDLLNDIVALQTALEAFGIEARKV